MSTKKTKRSGKKASGKAKKGGSKKGKGLKGTASEKFAAVKKSFGATIAKPGGFATGFGLATLAGWGISKIKFLQLDTTKPDTFQAKSLVKPCLLLAAGVTAVAMTGKKKQPVMEFVNGIGWGFVTAGTFNVVTVVGKAVFKKDVFQGLSGGEANETAKALKEVEFYKAKANDTAALLEANKHLIQLPELANRREVVEGIPTREEEAEARDTALVFGGWR